MNLLDENFPADQAALLREAGVPHRQLGRDISYLGIQDPDVIPLLHKLKRVTLFTQDEDFFKQSLCHPSYCVAWLNVKPAETAVTFDDSCATRISTRKRSGWEWLRASAIAGSTFGGEDIRGNCSPIGRDG